MVLAGPDMVCKWMEELPPNTESYWLENGQMLFFRNGQDQELYWWTKEGVRLQADLSTVENELVCAGSRSAYNDSIFLYSTSKERATFRFYEAKVNGAGENLGFVMNYELQLEEPGIDLWFALHKPFYLLSPSKNQDRVVLFGFMERKSLGIIPIDASVNVDLFDEFFMYGTILYLLVDKPELSIKQIHRNPGYHTVVAITIPDLASVGCRAQDSSDFVYILTQKTMLIIHLDTILYKVQLTANNDEHILPLDGHRSITGISIIVFNIYCTTPNLLFNIHNPATGKMERWRTKLIPSYLRRDGIMNPPGVLLPFPKKDRYSLMMEDEQTDDWTSEYLLIPFMHSPTIEERQDFAIYKTLTAEDTETHANGDKTKSSKSKSKSNSRNTTKKNSKLKKTDDNKLNDSKHEATRKEKEFVSRFLEDFKPIRIIGSGAFGTVFEAEKVLDKRFYAVKRVYLQKSNDNQLKEALFEVSTMAQFDHPGIVRYYHAWIERPPSKWQVQSDIELNLQSSNKPIAYHDNCVFIYIQMQLCDRTLEDWLKSNKKNRDSMKMKSWLKQMLEAINYIHGKKIFHRDLKPSNILFDAEGVLKICDLGIATGFETSRGKEKTRTRTEKAGTAIYQSPEQNYWIYKSEVDIFTIGLIFAEMSVPMTAAARNKAFDNYRKGIPNDILKSQPATEEFVLWMTTIDPDKRPKSREILDSPFLAN